MLFLLHLPSQGKNSSLSLPAPAWRVSHGRQSSIIFFNVGPHFRLQFLLNCSSMGCPWDCKSCQQTCSTLGSLRGHSFLLHLLQWGSSTGLQVISAPLQTPCAAGVQLLRQGLYSGLQRNICIWCLENSFCPFFTGCSHTYSHSLCLQLPCPVVRLPHLPSFLDTLPLRLYHCCWWAQPWPIEAPS